jgi:hypothetical protein
VYKKKTFNERPDFPFQLGQLLLSIAEKEEKVFRFPRKISVQTLSQSKKTTFQKYLIYVSLFRKKLLNISQKNL